MQAGTRTNDPAREKMKPVIDKHSAILGADVVGALQAELAKLRK